MGFHCIVVYHFLWCGIKNVGQPPNFFDLLTKLIPLYSAVLGENPVHVHAMLFFIGHFTTPHDTILPVQWTKIYNLNITLQLLCINTTHIAHTTCKKNIDHNIYVFTYFAYDEDLCKQSLLLVSRLTQINM